MTDKPPLKLLIALVSTRARATMIGQRDGLAPAEVLWPRTLGDLDGRGTVPVYVDLSLWDHPAADDLADYFAARVRAQERRRARKTQLARGRSSALN